MARSTAKLAVVEVSRRPIRSVYYSDLSARTVEKVNRGAHARSAVPRAVDHMQVNHYAAALCEVYDDTTGELHAVILPGCCTAVYGRPGGTGRGIYLVKNIQLGLMPGRGGGIVISVVNDRTKKRKPTDV